MSKKKHFAQKNDEEKGLFPPPHKELSLIVYKGKRAVVKKMTQRSTLYPPDAFFRDAYVSQYVGKYGITPQVFSLHTSPAAYVQQYVRGRVLSYQKDGWKAARTLARLHSLPLPSSLVTLLPSERYYERHEKLRMTPQEARLLSRHYPALWKFFHSLHTVCVQMKEYAMKVASPTRTICHNDTVATNWVVARKAYLVDFEWATIDYPESDVACFLSPFGAAWTQQTLPVACEKEVLVEYANEAAVPLSLLVRRVACALPFVLFSHAWWVAQILLSPTSAHDVRSRYEVSYARHVSRERFLTRVQMFLARYQKVLKEEMNVK